MRYQRLYGDMGLRTNYYFNRNAKLGLGNRGILDVISNRTNTIYDFKFGRAYMSSSQRAKYIRNFPNYNISIIRPQ